MSFCQGCGKQLVESSRFCDICGRAVPSTEAEASSVPVDAAPEQDAQPQPFVEPIAPPQPVTQPDASAQPVAVPPTPKKGAAGLVLVIVGAVLAVLLVVCVGGYFAYRAIVGTGPTTEEYVAEMTPVFEDLQRLAEDIERQEMSAEPVSGQTYSQVTASWAADAASIDMAVMSVEPPEELNETDGEILLRVTHIADAFARLADNWSDEATPLTTEERDSLADDLLLAYRYFSELQAIADDLGIDVDIADLSWVGVTRSSAPIVTPEQVTTIEEPPVPGTPREETEGSYIDVEYPDLRPAMEAFARANTDAGVASQMTVEPYEVLFSEDESAPDGPFALGLATLPGGDGAWIIMHFERDAWVGDDFGSGIDPADSVPSDVAEAFQALMQ